MGISPVIQFPESWCDMVWNSWARNRTRDILSQGESTISYIVTLRCAIFNSIDKLPELYFISAQRTSTTVYLFLLLIYRPRKDERPSWPSKFALVPENSPVSDVQSPNLMTAVSLDPILIEIDEVLLRWRRWWSSYCNPENPRFVETLLHTLHGLSRKTHSQRGRTKRYRWVRRMRYGLDDGRSFGWSSRWAIEVAYSGLNSDNTNYTSERSRRSGWRPRRRLLP